MLFNTLDFVFFFFVVIVVYFSLPHRFRWILLLAASYYFYMCWKAEYIILILASTLIDYFAGIMIGRAKEQRNKRLFLILSICSNVGMLFFFKYWDFFNDNMRMLFAQFNIMYNVRGFNFLLPVGISFYTFQSMSYTIDVYRGNKEPEKHFGIFALYIAYFPQLVAGPIERSTHLFPQLTQRHPFSYDRAVGGMRLILWGMVKKIVVADRLALYVDPVFSNVGMHNTPTYIMASWLFAIQVYCDFSAYSDIAIGTARIMGIDLRLNFNKIYWSKSVTEYWRRNHISLTSWFRDYIYIPLGGSRVARWRWYANIMIMFLISGLWHGAAWTFVFWGALNGAYLVYEVATRGIRARISEKWPYPKLLPAWSVYKTILTFNLIAFGLMFFRSRSLADAFEIVQTMLGGNWGDLYTGNTATFVYGIASLFPLYATEWLQGDGMLEDAVGALKLVYRWAWYILCVLAILLFGVFDGGQFIYFQF